MNSISQLPKPDLSHGRSNQILRLLLRNHISNNAAIHELVMPEVKPATSQKMIQKLIKREYLRRWPLHGSKSYLRLGAAAIARWQYPAAYARRLGPQVLPYQLGCLSLMTYHKPTLKRLLPEEIFALFDGFPNTRKLTQWAYYLDPSANAKSLVTVRVEYRVGGHTAVQKVAEQIHRYRRFPTVSELIDTSRFHVHIVTATPQQEIAIWEAADHLNLPVEIRTSHDPSLVMFL